MRNARLAMAVVAGAVCAQAQDFSPERLARRNAERRAVEAVTWGMLLEARYDAPR